MYGTLGPADMARFREGNHLNISTSGPAFKIAFPAFAAFLDQWPDLDKVEIDLLGNVQERETVTSGWKLGNPEHKHKKRLKWARLTPSQKVVRSRILQACKLMRWSVMSYQRGMELFDHRWRDNHTPAGGHAAQHWLTAVNCAALWFDLATALGYTIPDPNPGFNFHVDRHFFNEWPERYGVFDRETWTLAPSLAPFNLDSHAPIVTSCIQAMWSAQRVLETERAKCDLALNAPGGNGTVTKDSIMDLQNVWVYMIPYGHEQLRPFWVERNDRPPGHPEAVLWESRCQRQKAAENAYNQRGGPAYALQCRESHATMSHALMVINNALHLLAAFCWPKPPDAQTWERSGEAHGLQGEGVHTFSRAEPTENSYNLFGSPCPFVPVHSWSSEPFSGIVVPCQDPTDLDRLPYPPPPNPGREFIWDNTIHTDTFAETVHAWIADAVEWHRQNADAYYDPRADAWLLEQLNEGADEPGAPHA